MNIKVNMICVVFFGLFLAFNFAGTAIAGDYSPNQPFLDCVEKDTKKHCEQKYPVEYRGVIPDLYFNVEIISENALCLNIKKIVQEQQKIKLEYMSGGLINWGAGSADSQAINIDIKRETAEGFCADGYGFVLTVKPEFVKAWQAAGKYDKSNSISNLWVSYKRGDWVELPLSEKIKLFNKKKLFN